MTRPDLTFVDTWPAGMRPNDMVSFEQLEELVAYARELEADAEMAKALIRRGWDDHMWSFECMDERDEAWLLTWAGHPSGPQHAAIRGKPLPLEEK